MRICKCGGHIREHALTDNRVAWTCASCGRYEAVNLQPQRRSPDAARTQNPEASHE